jgi:KEOPS complex subunit Cgi121
MLKRVEEFGKYVEITGFRDVKVGDVKDMLKTLYKGKSSEMEMQFFDATTIATWKHLYFAALNAIKAFEGSNNISNSLAIETLLFASGQHQITKATGLVGIKPTSSDVAVLIIGKNPKIVGSTLSKVTQKIGGTRNDAVLGLSDAKKKKLQEVFSITLQELEATSHGQELEESLVDLVIERVALVSVQN